MKRARNKVLTENQHANVQRYTRADVEAWLETHTHDKDIPEAVFTDTVGFAFFVLGRRAAEAGGEVKKEFQRLLASYRDHQARAIRRFWNS